MAVTALWLGQGLLGQFSATGARRVDWENDTIKCALVGTTWTPNQDTDDFWNDVNTDEISGTGYTAGGEALVTATPAYDSATNTLRLDADDVVWGPPATITFRYAVVYKDTGSPTTSPLLGYVDFGGDESVVSGQFDMVWDATDGVLRITAD